MIVTPDYLTYYKSDRCITLKTPVFVDITFKNGDISKKTKNHLLFKTNTIYLKNKSNSFSFQLKIGGIPLKTVKISIIEPGNLSVVGKFIGIKLMTNGILVIGYSQVYLENSKPKIPAREAGIQVGDEIICANGQELRSCEQLSEIINSSHGKPVELLVKRKECKKKVKVKPLLSSEGVYKIGLWVRDGTSGIGTLHLSTKQKRYSQLLVMEFQTLIQTYFLI